MRAAVLHEYSAPRCGEFAEPETSGGQAVVEVNAAVNPLNVLLSSGAGIDRKVGRDRRQPTRSDQTVTRSRSSDACPHPNGQWR
jgi:hypothetical protein